MTSALRLRPVFGVVLGIPLLFGAQAVVRAGGEIAPPDTLEAWVPSDFAAYLKVLELGQRLESFLKSDARRDLESIPVVRFLLSQEPWQKFQQGLDDFRIDSGKDPLQVFRDLLGLEVLIAHKPQEGETVLLTRAAGEKELEGALQAIRQAFAQKLGYTPEGYRSSRGDRSIETIGEASFASLGRVWVIANRVSTVERVIDLAEGKAKESLKGSPLFEKVSRSGGKGALIAFAVRPGDLPNFSIPGKHENPLGSLLLGGLQGALGGSELLTGALRVAGENLELDLSSFEAKATEKYGAFFPPAAPDPVAGRLQKRGVLALGEFHRDLKKWWDQRDELLAPNAVGDLINFNQIMSIVFGGRSFQEEILPHIGSTITIVARNQGYKDLSQKPKPAIPAFAGLFELKDTKDLPSTLISGFQTLIGIINNDRIQKEPEAGVPFTLKTEKVGDVDLQVAAANLPKDGAPGMTANFSPSLAVVGSRLVISSSAELAKVVVEEIQGGRTGGTTVAGREPDTLVIQSEPVDSIIRENLDLIVQDNMRKKGIGREQAEGEMNAVLDVLKRVRDLSLQTRRDGDQVQMKMTLRHRLGGEAAPAKAGEKKAASF